MLGHHTYHNCMPAYKISLIYKSPSVVSTPNANANSFRGNMAQPNPAKNKTVARTKKMAGIIFLTVSTACVNSFFVHDQLPTPT